MTDLPPRCCGRRKHWLPSLIAGKCFHPLVASFRHDPNTLPICVDVTVFQMHPENGELCPTFEPKEPPCPK